MLSRRCGEFYMTFHSNLYHNQLIPTESNQLFFSDHIQIREYHRSTIGAENLRNESTLKMNLDLSCSILLFFYHTFFLLASPFLHLLKINDTKFMQIENEKHMQTDRLSGHRKRHKQ